MARPIARALGHPIPFRAAGASSPRQAVRTAASVVNLRFALPRAALTDVHVVDERDRRVRTLACGELTAGEHAIVWDGLDESGARCPAGRYILRLETAGSLLTSRVVSLA